MSAQKACTCPPNQTQCVNLKGILDPKKKKKPQTKFTKDILRQLGKFENGLRISASQTLCGDGRVFGGGFSGVTQTDAFVKCNKSEFFEK